MRKNIFIPISLLILFGCNTNSRDKNIKVHNLSNQLLTQTILPYCEYRGQQYKVVKIGSQVWFAENLNSSIFNNGDTIFQAKSSSEWKNALKKRIPAWCYQSYNKNKYGYLGKIYNWYAISDIRGVSPEGWHVPQKKEWDRLINFCGGNENASKKLKSETDWINGQWDYSGTDEFGFSALPNGYIELSGDDFHISSNNSLGSWWWTSTVVEYNGPKDIINNFIHTINIDQLDINDLHQISNGISSGLFVRCIKNE